MKHISDMTLAEYREACTALRIPTRAGYATRQAHAEFQAFAKRLPAGVKPPAEWTMAEIKAAGFDLYGSR